MCGEGGKGVLFSASPLACFWSVYRGVGPNRLPVLSGYAVSILLRAGEWAPSELGPSRKCCSTVNAAGRLIICLAMSTFYGLVRDRCAMVYSEGGAIHPLMLTMYTVLTSV